MIGLGELKAGNPYVMAIEISRGKSKNRKNIKCFQCNRMGHMKKECIFLKRKEGEGSKEEKEANTVSADDQLIIANDESCVSLVC